MKRLRSLSVSRNIITLQAFSHTPKLTDCFQIFPWWCLFIGIFVVITSILRGRKCLNLTHCSRHLIFVSFSCFTWPSADTRKRGGGDEWEERQCHLPEWRASHHSWPGVCQNQTADRLCPAFDHEKIEARCDMRHTSDFSFVGWQTVLKQGWMEWKGHEGRMGQNDNNILKLVLQTVSAGRPELEN